MLICKLKDRVSVYICQCVCVISVWGEGSVWIQFKADRLLKRGLGFGGRGKGFDIGNILFAISADGNKSNY